MQPIVQAVEKAYLERVEAGELESDLIQQNLTKALDGLSLELQNSKLSSKSSSLGWLFGNRQKQSRIKGLYIWGGVGRGKSMLMDLFFAQTNFSPKRRVHFHDFMAEVQKRIHEHRKLFKDGKTKEEDPIPPVAKAIAKEAMLLCFDEFSVSDIADAMILGRLFKVLFAEGVVIVATSNVEPSNLYKDGLNRQLFLPFIKVLQEHCETRILDARTDYRLEKLIKAPVYLTPLGAKTTQSMNRSWELMSGGASSHSESLVVNGRKVNIPQAVDGIARFTFSDLCEQPLGAQDYLAIVRNYHTIFIDDIPVMEIEQRNYAKRFIILIDTLYDHLNKLVVSAAAPPEKLYRVKKGVEAFEFDRTISRLIEMQSVEYMAGEGKYLTSGI